MNALLSPAAGRRQRQELMAQIARDQRKQQRQHLVDLRAQVRQARADRKGALEQAKARCRAERLAARDRVQVLRERVLQELRQAVDAERASARETCSVRLSAARGIADRIARARAELEAERTFQRDMRRIERSNRQRTRQVHRTTAAEQRSQSDDEVRRSIPEELVPLWERVKRSIRGSDRVSRLESFLEYAEANPGSVLEAIEDRSDALVRELEERERAASRAFRETPFSPEAFADRAPESRADSVPF
jgi:hypothetical protein